MDPKKSIQDVRNTLNAKQGLGSILAPVDSKVQELREFAGTAYSKANAFRKEAEGLLLQADRLDDAERAERVANKLEEAVR